MGATLNVAKPKKGSTVAIFGLGGVGLGVRFNLLELKIDFWMDYRYVIYRLLR